MQPQAGFSKRGREREREIKKMLPFFLRCVHGNGIKNVAIAASTIRSTSNMRHEQTRGLSCLCMQIRECRCSAASSLVPRSGNSSGATVAELVVRRRTWNCWRREGGISLLSLPSRIKSIFFEGNNKCFVAWKFLSTTSYQRQPFLVLVNLIPSLSFSLSRPPSGVCKLLPCWSRDYIRAYRITRWWYSAATKTWNF